MRSSAWPFRTVGLTALAGLGAALGVVCVVGCATSQDPVVSPGTGGKTAGTGGALSGSGGGTISGSGGSVGSGGAVEGTGGAPLPDASGDGVGPADANVSEASGDAAWGGSTGIEDFSTVKMTAGCGQDPGQMLNAWVNFMVTIPPPGANRGTGNRVYFVKLPTNYDNKKPYFVIFIAPGCGGGGMHPNGWDFATAAGTEGVIQIGLQPDPGSSPNGACFDDMRKDSVDYKYVETILASTAKNLCYDQHRVFMTGHSSGGWLSNQMGCVYGMKLLRAVAPSSGGLATGATSAPPCTDLPTPGIWSHNEMDVGNLPIGTQRAITRALKTNKCQGDFMTSPRATYDDPTNGNCQRFTSCPAEFPIVYCHPTTGGHLDNLPQQPARSWRFFKSLP
ncbi:MAG: polyhydroxybutyrate depolymerase [Myxococcales bacterium]|nr:polyhydroxybutyrate depolymerase [Myxococcales bacterium]